MNAAELRDPSTWESVQKDQIHLQRCLAALDKIKGIAGEGSPIAAIADAAIKNKTPHYG